LTPPISPISTEALPSEDFFLSEVSELEKEKKKLRPFFVFLAVGAALCALDRTEDPDPILTMVPVPSAVTSKGPPRQILVCRSERGDDNFEIVRQLIKYDEEKWDGVWKGHIAAARGPVSEQEAEDYHRLFKAQVNSHYEAVSVPEDLCPEVPLESIAFAHIAQEMCYKREAAEPADLIPSLREFYVPTVTSQCKSRLVTRLYADSNGQKFAGIKIKVIIIYYPNNNDVKY
jgi:hypothetical protein